MKMCATTDAARYSNRWLLVADGAEMEARKRHLESSEPKKGKFRLFDVNQGQKTR
jgi:hypothetical protein